MMIYTSFYDNVENIPEDIVKISIAGWCPDDYTGLQYKVLAPKWSFFEKWKYKKEGFEDCYQNNDYYIENFYELVLNKLNPKKVYKRLMELSGGKDVVLLCYETPELFCHRHLVQKWFNDNGIECKEYIPLPKVI